jgi:hypothetical protein
MFSNKAESYILLLKKKKKKERKGGKRKKKAKIFSRTTLSEATAGSFF